MSLLGNVGYLYMLMLILLLIIGFGLVGLKLVNYVLDVERPSVKKDTANLGFNKPEIIKWLRIALISFVGILITIMLLTTLRPNGMQ